MTQLSEYLSANGLRQSVFATMVGATQSTISKLIGGSIQPSLDLAVRIERETGGAVPATSWVPLPQSEPTTKDAA